MINNYNLLAKKDNTSLEKYSTDLTIKTNELSHQFKLERSCFGVRSVNVTSDNRYLIITFENNARIRVLDLERMQYLPFAYNGHSRTIRLTSITDNNKAFFTASWDCTVRKFEIESGECTLIFSGFGRSPSCYADNHEKYLFTASYDSDFDLDSKNTGRCWDLSTGKILTKYKHTEHRCTLESIDIAYDGDKVYTASDDGCAYQWNLKREKPLLKYFSFKGSVRKIAVSENYFAAACTDGIIRVHHKLSGEYYNYFKHGNTEVRDVRISKDETKLWSAASNGSVACFNLLTCEIIYRCRHHYSWIWSMCLMNNEKTLVTGSGNGLIDFLNAITGEKLIQLYNLPWDNEFLVSSPPDNALPNGCFYTSNKDFIEVVMEDKSSNTKEILDLNDPRRKSYINKLNLKNLIITRLKNNGQYVSLTDKYIQNQKIFQRMDFKRLPQMLKA